MLTVDIGVATFRRPEFLPKLLDSLASIDVPEKCRIRLIIADNDQNGSALPMVANLKEGCQFEILYILVPSRGISYARNAILEMVDAEYLAFLDDDETVEPEWLKAMLHAIKFYKADVVFGPVRGNLPVDAPRWALTSPVFVRPSRPSGTTVQTGGSGNVLIKTQILLKLGLKFDPEFALTGGSDTHFFHQIWKAGHVMVWCSDAVAYEDVPQERLRLTWVLKRSYRGGQCFARVLLAEKPFIERAIRVTIKFLVAVIAASAASIVALTSLPLAVRLSCQAADWTGQFFAIFMPGQWYQEYSAPSYRPSKEKQF